LALALELGAWNLGGFSLVIWLWTKWCAIKSKDVLVSQLVLVEDCALEWNCNKRMNCFVLFWF
jgi:hypothetical protein